MKQKVADIACGANFSIILAHGEPGIDQIHPPISVVTAHDQKMSEFDKIFGMLCVMAL